MNGAIPSPRHLRMRNLFFAAPPQRLTMPLPETIQVRRAEENAGYLAMTPVMTQTFRLADLVDMVVSVAGKDARRVQHILGAGAAVYNGYHYSWQGLAAQPAEIAALLEKFPDDNPARSLDPESITAALLEIGGGTQRTLVEIPRDAASAHRLFSRRTPWEVLLALTEEFPARYDKYDHARHGDLFRVSLHYDDAERLLAAIKEVAPRSLRLAWRGLRPPAAVIFLSPRVQARSS